MVGAGGAREEGRGGCCGAGGLAGEGGEAGARERGVAGGGGGGGGAGVVEDGLCRNGAFPSQVYTVLRYISTSGITEDLIVHTPKYLLWSIVIVLFDC